MKNKAKWFVLGIPACLFGVGILLVTAVLVIGPNDRRKEIRELDRECFELVQKVQDRATADFYEPALQAKLGEAIQKLKSQEYIDAFTDDSFFNVLYDYCHYHQALWFGTDTFRLESRLTSTCRALIEREAYGNRTLDELLKVYLNERIIFHYHSMSLLSDRMLWNPDTEEIERIFN